MVQAGGPCRSGSHSPLPCLLNFPPVDPVPGLWPNLEPGRSGDIPVFAIHISAAASTTSQVTVELCSLQVHQCWLLCRQPALKTPGTEVERSVRLPSPCSLQHRTVPFIFFPMLLPKPCRTLQITPLFHSHLLKKFSILLSLTYF